MYCEDFKGLSYMAKPSSWDPGNLSQVGEIQVTLVSETGAHSSPAWIFCPNLLSDGSAVVSYHA